MEGIYVHAVYGPIDYIPLVVLCSIMKQKIP